MTIKEKCFVCNGDGWVTEPIEYPTGFEWEQAKCTHCDGSGYIEIEDMEEKMSVKFDFWPCARPMTKKWGSGQVFERISRSFDMLDVAFGKTDGIPDGIFAVDKNTGYEWNKLPFENNQFKFGYWDPPYDKLYKKEALEIWRTCLKLAILHTHVYPTSWFAGAKRTGMVAVTFGPLKQIRILQVFDKSQLSLCVP